MSRRGSRSFGRVRKGAVRKLERAERREVFTDFVGAKGRSLRQNLDEGDASSAEYAELEPLFDGSSAV